MHDNDRSPSPTRRSKTPPGIRVRHARTCRSRKGGSCNCHPTYEAWVYSKRDKKKIRRSFPTLAAARGWRTDAQKLVKDRRLKAPSPKTLREEVDEWLAGARSGNILNKREKQYKPGVIRNYEIALRLRVLPDLGEMRLDAIDLGDLLALKERLQGAGCSGSTVRNSFVPLQAIYRRARLDGRVAVDPTTDLPLPVAGSRSRAASPGEAAELLEVLGDPERAIWATAFYAGLRRGELRALRLRNIDFEAATISVEKGWDSVEGEIEPKSIAGVRTVFLADVLRPHLEPLVVKADDPDSLLFGTDSERPFEPRNIARKAERAWRNENRDRTKAAGESGGDHVKLLSPIGLHEARHSFSTWVDHAGISETRADRYMGHSSGAVAGRYRHLLPGQLTEDRRAFDRFITGTMSGKVVPIAAALGV